jgi:hypothetical protein
MTSANLQQVMHPILHFADGSPPNPFRLSPANCSGASAKNTNMQRVLSLQRWCALRRASRRGSWLRRAGGGARGSRWRSGKKEEGNARALELRARRRAAAAARAEGGARVGATEVKSSSWIWAEEGGGGRGTSRRRPNLRAREGAVLAGAPSSDLPLPPPGRQRARTPPGNGRASGDAEAVAEAAPAPPLRHGALRGGPAPPPVRNCVGGTGGRGRVEELRRGGGPAGHGGGERGERECKREEGEWRQLVCSSPGTGDRGGRLHFADRAAAAAGMCTVDVLFSFRRCSSRCTYSLRQSHGISLFAIPTAIVSHFRPSHSSPSSSSPNRWLVTGLF